MGLRVSNGSMLVVVCVSVSIRTAALLWTIMSYSAHTSITTCAVGATEDSFFNLPFFEATTLPVPPDEEEEPVDGGALVVLWPTLTALLLPGAEAFAIVLTLEPATTIDGAPGVPFDETLLLPTGADEPAVPSELLVLFVR